ncbi:MAG: hypothetical protein UT09_C0039G0006 [Parcubacteria group bacterium GW2011_GWF2_38_8]|nr:MAG: hypothetical protein UT09_C0039G0006 [Parcubacteria group bacterium GW2011_GWF2_38_8]
MRRFPLTIFLFSVPYILVFLFPVFCLLNPKPVYAQPANLFFSVPSSQVQEGERITIRVEVSSPEQSINAVSGIVFFPANLARVVSFSKEKSIINLWTQEPKLISNRILFEGVILNPGFQAKNGIVFQITFEAKKAGLMSLGFNQGSILANDGLGTNVLAGLRSSKFNIISAPGYFSGQFNASTAKPMTLPVITKYFPTIGAKEVLYLRGEGEPLALTKIIFRNLSVKSIGEKLIALLRSKKEELDEVIVKNNDRGIFRYVSGSDLVAGVYSATPFLIDSNKNTELPGPSVQLLVSDSEIVKNTVVVLNVMGLLVPIVLLGVIIYFIPWYSWRKMRLMKGKMLLEEEKTELTAEELKQNLPPPTPPISP